MGPPGTPSQARGGSSPAALGRGLPFALSLSKGPSNPYLPRARTADVPLREAYAYCQEVTRRSSSNFYYAFRLLPPERREALCAVYAFCRFVDDIADDAGRRNPHGLLTRWREELARTYDGAPAHPIAHALADTVRRFPIAQQHFLDLIRGVELDLTRRRYATFDELYEYCYLVASTVGLMCIEIFGHRHPSAREYAVDLGIAFQLTNILRDVSEDAGRGRIYLPLEDLRRFDCREDDLLGGRYSPRVGALMALECGRARAYYLRAGGALAPEDRCTLAPAEAMRLIYERLLARIEARQFDVFGSRGRIADRVRPPVARSPGPGARFSGVIGTTTQWVFNRSKVLRQRDGGGQCLSAVISAGHEVVQWENARIADTVVADLRAVVPAARAAEMVRCVVVKEKHATISTTPEAEGWRPAPHTPIGNLFLAGDWTSTGLPPTIEGAVLSGERAAALVAERLRGR